MENRRFILFIIGSILILVGNVWLMSKLNPQPPQQPAAQQKQNGGPDNKIAAADKGNANGDKAAEQNPPAENAAAANNVPEAPEPATQWFTLGSGDTSPNNPYKLLVTLTNHGGAVERIELSSSRYRELDNRTGYLGHLAAENAAGGVKVNLVAPGTPAEEAGLKPNDVITAVNGKAVANGDELQAAFKETVPDQSIELEVSRNGQPQTLHATLGHRPLEVVRPEKFTSDMLTPEPLDIVSDNTHDPFSFLLTMQQLGDKRLPDRTAEEIKAAAEDPSKLIEAELPGVKLRNVNWDTKQIDADTVEFSRTLQSAGLQIVKRYKIAKAEGDKPGYHFTLDIELKNVGPSALKLAYQLDGPTGLPTEGWWYTSRPGRSWGAVGVRNTALLLQGKDPALISPMATAAGNLEPPYRSESPDVLLAYAGVDAQYFASALLPVPMKDRQPWLAQIKPIVVGHMPKDQRYQTLGNISCRLVSNTETLEPGAPLKHTYTVFAGPKQPTLLAQYPLEGDPQDNLSELVYYGWPIWAVVARPLTHVLHFFYSIVGNFGLAIIMLTLLVRACMFPISRKQAQNAQKMQELKPEMDRINEKYKGKPEEKTRAMQELWRKHNHNPMAGCLPAFLQIPIFLGLYRALWIDVELRQAPLFGSAIHWCSNLAAPDMLWHWKNAPFIPGFISAYRGFASLGPFFNLLPLFAIGLFLVQQKMVMPPATDDQTRTQQKMMNYMFIFIGYLYYNVTSGLLLYIIVSSVWGILERKLLPKSQPKTGALAMASASSGNGGGARRDRKKRGR